MSRSLPAGSSNALGHPASGHRRALQWAAVERDFLLDDRDAASLFEGSEERLGVERQLRGHPARILRRVESEKLGPYGRAHPGHPTGGVVAPVRMTGLVAAQH